MASPEPLPVDVVVRCTRQAQRDGIFAGVSAGLAGSIIGSKLFRFNRNTALVSGAVTGVLVGYQLTQVFLATNLARVKAAQAQANATAKEFDEFGASDSM